MSPTLYRLTVLAVLAVTALLLAACAGPEPGTPEAGSPAEEPQKPEDRKDAVTVAEAWKSPFHEPDNVDSPAFWQGVENGEPVSRVIATGKESHDLLVYDADTGESVERIGSEGDGPGQLRRPNGVMVLGDRAWVVERDNRRVQIFSLPDGDSLATLGEDVLRRPYGLTLFESEPGTVELYVTDNYLTPEEEIPPAAELGERVKHFRITEEDGRPVGRWVRSFGDTEGPGILTKVETLLADPEQNRLLIADEHENGMVLKIYDLEGNFTGEVLGSGHFFHEAEGLALRTCGTDGYWIATDQAPDLSLFRVFRRTDLNYLGTFVGELTANTDGVTQTSLPTDRFPAGAFFAVHDDQGVTAFDWRAVAEALGLPDGC